jgi:hypothetical protein
LRGGTVPKIETYQPFVCPKKECMGYGDTVPSDYGRCFICYTPLVHFSEIPYEDINPFVRRVMEHVHETYGERYPRGDMVEQI